MEKPSESLKLRRCPFCGHNVLTIEFSGYGIIRGEVECTKCGSRASDKIWNKRAVDIWPVSLIFGWLFVLTKKTWKRCILDTRDLKKLRQDNEQLRFCWEELNQKMLKVLDKHDEMKKNREKIHGKAK